MIVCCFCKAMSGCLEVARRLPEAVDSRGQQRDKNMRQDMPPVGKKPFGGLSDMKKTRPARNNNFARNTLWIFRKPVILQDGTQTI